MRRKISADVDGGLSGVSRCADTGARTPIGVSGNYTQNNCNVFKIMERFLGNLLITNIFEASYCGICSISSACAEKKYEMCKSEN
jgi:hypothetical protein